MQTEISKELRERLNKLNWVEGDIARKAEIRGEDHWSIRTMNVKYNQELRAILRLCDAERKAANSTPLAEEYDSFEKLIENKMRRRKIYVGGH